MKFPEENIGEYLHDIECGNEFLGMQEIVTLVKFLFIQCKYLYPIVFIRY